MKSVNSGEINALLCPGLCDDDDDDVYSGLYGVVILICCASSNSHTLSSLVNAKWMTVAVAVTSVVVASAVASSSVSSDALLSVSVSPRDARLPVTRGGWV